MKEINNLTKGKAEIEAYLKRERRRKFMTLRGYLPRRNYLDENESWKLLPHLPNRLKFAFIDAKTETIKDVLDYSMNQFMTTRSF